MFRLATFGCLRLVVSSAVLPLCRLGWFSACRLYVYGSVLRITFPLPATATRLLRLRFPVTTLPVTFCLPLIATCTVAFTRTVTRLPFAVLHCLPAFTVVTHTFVPHGCRLRYRLLRTRLLPVYAVWFTYLPVLVHSWITHHAVRWLPRYGYLQLPVTLPYHVTRLGYARLVPVLPVPVTLLVAVTVHRTRTAPRLPCSCRSAFRLPFAFACWFWLPRWLHRGYGCLSCHGYHHTAHTVPRRHHCVTVAVTVTPATALVRLRGCSSSTVTLRFPFTTLPSCRCVALDYTRFYAHAFTHTVTRLVCLPGYALPGCVCVCHTRSALYTAFVRLHTHTAHTAHVVHVAACGYVHRHGYTYPHYIYHTRFSSFTVLPFFARFVLGSVTALHLPVAVVYLDSRTHTLRLHLPAVTVLPQFCTVTRILRYYTQPTVLVLIRYTHGSCLYRGCGYTAFRLVLVWFTRTDRGLFYTGLPYGSACRGSRFTTPAITPPPFCVLRFLQVRGLLPAVLHIYRVPRLVLPAVQLRFAPAFAVGYAATRYAPTATGCYTVHTRFCVLPYDLPTVLRLPAACRVYTRCHTPVTHGCGSLPFTTRLHTHTRLPHFTPLHALRFGFRTYTVTAVTHRTDYAVTFRFLRGCYVHGFVPVDYRLLRSAVGFVHTVTLRISFAVAVLQFYTLPHHTPGYRIVVIPHRSALVTRLFRSCYYVLHTQFCVAYIPGSAVG